MKRFLLLCLSALFFVSMWGAEDETVYFVVVDNEGVETYFALDEEPITTYGDNTMTVSSASYTIEDMLLDSVLKCYYVDVLPSTEGIDTINTMDGPSAEFSNGMALIKGLKGGVQVYIYTADGQTIGSVVASTDGNVCIDLSSLKRGMVYILRTPSSSYKIVK